MRTIMRKKNNINRYFDSINKERLMAVECDCGSNNWKLIKLTKICHIVCNKCLNRFDIKKSLWKEMKIQKY